MSGACSFSQVVTWSMRARMELTFQLAITILLSSLSSWLLRLCP